MTNADSIDMSNMPKDTDRSKKAVNNNNNNNNSVNNFFDLFHSATMQSAQQQPQITDRALNLDGTFFQLFFFYSNKYLSFICVLYM